MPPDHLRASLRSRWAGLLPAQPRLGEELLDRWSEPHRYYHDLLHLDEALSALDRLDGGPLEHLALWFHDAVHRNRPGLDEEASAALAAASLRDTGLGAADVAEVTRLILLTLDHSPAADDQPGARVSDADIAVLGAPPGRYAASVRALRQEFDALDDGEWAVFRRRSVAALLGRPRLFHTETGRALWEVSAQRNLAGEPAD